MITCHEIDVVLWLFVELQNCIVGVDIAGGLDADDMGEVSKHFVADRVLIFAFLVFRPIHLYEFARL